MKRRCRSLLALPSLFGSAGSSGESGVEQAPGLLKGHERRTRLFRSSNQNVNSVSTTSSTWSHSHSSNCKNARRFFKSLLSSSKSHKSHQSDSQCEHQNKSNSTSQEPPTPPAIDWLLADLFRRGPSTVGVFRKSPNARHCRELKQRLDTAKDLSELDLDSYQVIVVASVFKECLRAMPDCLLTSRLYPHWIDVARLISLDLEHQKQQAKCTPTPSLQSLKIVRQLLARLGENKLQLLSSFVCVLTRIAQSSDYNKMSPVNLGVCVGQSLLVEELALASASKTSQQCKSRSKSRLDLSADSCQASASSAISCVPLLVAFMIENATLLFGDQLDQCARRYAALASAINATSASTSPSSPIETPTPSSSRPATPESEHRQRESPRTTIEGQHPSLPSSTPSPADSGRCTTSESSSSSSSSSASDSSFQMMRCEPSSPETTRSKSASSSSSTSSPSSPTNCDQRLSRPIEQEPATSPSSSVAKKHNHIESNNNQLERQTETETLINANNHATTTTISIANTQRASPTSPSSGLSSLSINGCDVTDSSSSAARHAAPSLKRKAPQPPKQQPQQQAPVRQYQAVAPNVVVSMDATQRRLAYKQTKLQKPQLQHQQPSGLVVLNGPRRAVSMSASDFAQAEQQALGVSNWCLSYYTPWQEPSRSHVMSLRDYYISLQLEHQRHQEQLNSHAQFRDNKLHNQHLNGYTTTTATRVPPIHAHANEPHLYQQQQQQQRHSIHLASQQHQQQFPNLSSAHHQFHHLQQQQQIHEQNQRSLHRHHLLNHRQAPFVAVRPFAGSDEYIESTLV